MTLEDGSRAEKPLATIERYLEVMRGTNAREYVSVSGILDNVLFNQQVEKTRETRTWAVISALNGYRPEERVIRGRRIGAVLHVLHGAIVGNHVEQSLLPKIGTRVCDTLAQIREEDITLPEPQETITDLLDTIITVEFMIKGGDSSAILDRAAAVRNALTREPSPGLDATITETSGF